ncbi:MAG: glyoxalase [Lachnospiraceae bacterium]|nr:glyoxalase [Lachnospiraceae bacterium]
MEYDGKVLDVFLKDQCKLFPEEVAANREEADDFLAECMAVVVNSEEEVWEYFEEEGIDMEDVDRQSVLDIEEVFEIGDGRYLIVEA